MTTDISRKTFDHRRSTAWTTTMQGRVATDAPKNEDKRIRDRRLRAGMVDLIGRCGYPEALPTSFEISVVGGGLQIGAGRYYVDGHVPENFGVGAETFDDVLSEMRAPGPVPFDEQPFLPGVVPDAPADGLHLVYLDVWQRDVTFLEDDTILDPAVPVDTIARRQTVWQVRTFGPVPDDVTCDTPDADIPDWSETIAPSDARLTTRANPAQAQLDPCLLPPGAQYRGIDNRTYLYEVHDFDADGQPLVKFSRAHGVIATTILSQPQGDVLEVVEVAKDDFLRFNPGDWVEITDEARLLAGQAGVMARVLIVDDPSNTITLESALPAGTVRLDGAGPDLDQTFHPIIRRWDQSGRILDTDGNQIVDLDTGLTNGLIPVPTDGTFVALEDGVEAAFSRATATGPIRIGDRWTFIARYADSSVQELEQAPPEDFHHHYCRLALVEAAGGSFVAPVVSDCRDPIDLGGECCCTVVVAPGEDIQAAINSLPPDFGGCVCLKSGLHITTSPLQISTPNIVLRGESRGAIVRRTNDGPALQVINTSAVDVTSIRFEHRASAQGTNGIIEILGSNGVTVTACSFGAVRGTISAAIQCANASNISLKGNRIADVILGVSITVRCDHIRIEDNVMNLGGDNFVGQFGVTARNAIGPIRVTGNRIEGALTGVSINDDPTGASRTSLAAGSVVTNNDITLAQVPSNEGDPVVFFGIDTAAGDSQVHANRILFEGSARAGIRTSGIGSKVTENVVEANFVADDDALNIGIFAGNDIGQTHLSENITISENTLRAVSIGLFVRDARDVLVSGNEIDPFAANPVLPAIFLNECVATRVADNAIRSGGSGLLSTSGRHLKLFGNTISDCGLGVGLALEISPTVHNNSITNASLFGVLALLTVARTSFTENNISNVGRSGGLPFGLGALFVLGEWHVEANEIMNTGVPVDGTTNPSATHGIIGAFVMETRIESNLVTYSNPALLPDGREDRALLLQGLFEFSVQLGDRTVSLGFPCQITNNKFVGKGLSALVELRETSITDNILIRFERVFFSNNYCNHFGQGAESAGNATVILEGRAGVVMGNQIKTLNGVMPSVNMRNMSGTQIGNITTAGFINDPNFPTPETNFNRIL